MNCLLFSASEIASGTNRLKVSDRRADHIRSVLKSKVGDHIVLGELGGKLGTGNILSIDDTAVELSFELSRNPPPPLPVSIVVALPRPKSLRKIIHTATTMGVKTIYLTESWRVDKSYWHTPWLEESYLHDLMVLGLEQAVDTILPVIHLKRRFRPFVEDELPSIVKDKDAYVAHPLATVACPEKIARETVAAIGPEGGLIPFETELLEKQGFIPVTLGERILRVDEAVPALLGRFLV